MATATKIDIWNRALGRIGHTVQVSEEEEDSAAAQQCRINYDDCLKQVLEEFAWPFAVKQVVLTAPTDVTREGWEYVYSLPTDCVKPLGLVPEDTKLESIPASERFPFQLQLDDGGTWYLLCTDFESAEDFEVLEYISLMEYVPMYPAAFVSALAFLLARDLAYGLTKDPVRADYCFRQYQFEIARAKANMLNARVHSEPPTTPSILARG